MNQSAEPNPNRGAACEHERNRRQEDHPAVKEERARPHDPEEHLRDHPAHDRHGECPRELHSALGRCDAAFVLREAVLLRSGRRIDPPADLITGLQNGPHECGLVDGVIEHEARPFGRQVHGDRLHAGDRGESAFHRARTARAGHPLDLQFELAGTGSTSPVPGLGRRLDQPLDARPLVVLNRCPLGEEVNLRAGHARNTAQCTLDGLGAGCAVHPFDQ